MGIDLVKCCFEKEKEERNEDNSFYKMSENLPENVMNLNNNENKLEKADSNLQNIFANKSPFENYEILDNLGQGLYGKIYKVKMKRSDLKRSIKVISINQIKNNNVKENINNIFKKIIKLNHENLSPLHEVYEDGNNFYLVNDYYSAGNLIQFKGKNKLSENFVKAIMFKIFLGLSYLHSNQIIHGDLKLENIMITTNTFDSKENDINNENNDFLSNNNFFTENSTETLENEFCKHLDDFNIKLIDFGQYQLFNEISNNKNEGINFFGYCSPEYFINEYNSKSDIWSCGIILYYLLAGEMPFTGENYEEIKDKIIHTKYYFNKKLFKNVSLDAKDLIRRCLVFHPQERINIRDALNHKFFINDFKVIPSTRASDKHSKYSNKDDECIDDIIKTLIYVCNKSYFFQYMLNFIVHNCDIKRNVKQFKNIFTRIDLNNDGKISKDELNFCLIELDYKQNEISLNNIMNCIDLDKNGFVDFPEFLEVSVPIKDLLTSDNLLKFFRLFDVKQNGYIHISTLYNNSIFKQDVDNNKIKEILNQMEKNNDEDELTFEEFKSLVMKYTSSTE